MNLLEKFDFVTIGGGIIGLSLAREYMLRYPNHSVAIVDKEPFLGKHASGRNSGVLHAGIYYAKDSFKAQFCQRGSQALKAFANDKGIPIKDCGKFVVAYDENELTQLHALYERGIDNGLSIELMTEKEVHKREPLARTYKEAIWSPDTSVIKIDDVIKALAEELKDKGARFYLNSCVVDVDPDSHMVTLSSKKKLYYVHMANCAGSYADTIALYFGLCEELTLLPFKGLYRSLDETISKRLSTLIYPTPDPQFPFLGVHTNMTFKDTSYVGPGALPALGRENYGFVKDLNFIEAVEVISSLSRVLLQNSKIRRHSFEEIYKLHKACFDKKMQRLLTIPIAQHTGGYCKVGIRPQLYSRKKGELITDFMIELDRGTIHVLNAISPAFTASFAFARFCMDQLLEEKTDN